MIPSIFIGAVTVYGTVMEQNIANYLNNEFVFADTQVVQNSTDKMNRVISVSLVGMPVSDEKIAELEQELSAYSLDGYTLHVTQNKSIEGIESDKVTIAVQENTIADLQKQLEEQQNRLDELESTVAAKIDFNAVAGKAGKIFTVLTNCSCGVMADENGEYIVLAANASTELTAAERETITNWLQAESGLERAKLWIHSK